MKRLVLSTLFTISAVAGHANNFFSSEPPANSKEGVCYLQDNDIDVVPGFLGGDIADFIVWVGEKINPMEVAYDGLPDGIFARFCVEADGYVSNVGAVGVENYYLRRRIECAIANSPDWVPATKDGKATRVVYKVRIPIVYADVTCSEQEQREQERGEWGGGYKDHNYPRFRSGDLNTFREWVDTQVRYPEEKRLAGIGGRVIVQFIVKNDGTVGDVKIIQSPDEELSKEAIRVIKSSPRWSAPRFYIEGGIRWILPVNFR